jgi:hypothetical protein
MVITVFQFGDKTYSIWYSSFHSDVCLFISFHMLHEVHKSGWLVGRSCLSVQLHVLTQKLLNRF